jgi:hypothetical protein
VVAGSTATLVLAENLEHRTKEARESWRLQCLTGVGQLGKGLDAGACKLAAGDLLAVGELEAEILHLFLPSFEETLPYTATGSAALTPPPPSPDVQLLAMAPPCWPCRRQEGQGSVPLLPLSDARRPTHSAIPSPCAATSCSLSTSNARRTPSKLVPPLALPSPLAVARADPATDVVHDKR